MYALFLEPEVHEARKTIPGKVRQRIQQVLRDLANDPRPNNSRGLSLAENEALAEIEIRRLRLEKWRIVYAINDTEQWVRIFAIQKRPPYNYQDIPELLRRLSEE